VAEYLGTNHTEVKFTPQEGFEAIPHVIRDLESYDITTIRASVGMWLLAKYIAKNSEDIVLLSGEGADELFCGYLYFHYAPTHLELEQESFRLISELHMYDVLRADRCVSSHGLELRVPFLDRRLVEACLSLPGDVKCPQNYDGIVDTKIEKYLLRSAFAKEKYLPPEIIWRRKDGMSDGMSGNTGKKWYEQIQDFVDECVSDQEFQKYVDKFPFKEAYYYKKIFDDIFPTFQPKFKYWLPKWVDHGGDPSGRNLEIFKKD
jgi:asparagine synthase (glutamine-hydrolysing)